ncbi:acyltransferase family protein [Microbacterium sp. F51-2R]|uniref:acyltransferase family protein n=1 Tax=Microbacterium sp. F51-2R TaxID=3445777 RepID=UPI003FA02302
MPSGGAVAGRGFVIPSLDGLRFVAILLVVWGHAELPYKFIRESSGVTIFFFLSGYLITTLLRREFDKTERVSIKDFYLRRLFRIFPPLYIVVTIMVVLSLAGIIANQMTALGAASAYGFFANYYIIFAGREGLPGGMNALWSLAVEEHYYLLFPIIYIALRKWLPNRWWQAGVLAAICLAIMGWRVWLFADGASYDRIYLATDTRADAILWGSILAIIANPMYDEIRAPRRKRLLTPILLASVAVFYVVSRMPDSIGMTVGYTVQAVVLAGVFIPLILAPRSIVGRAMNWRPIMWVGVISYSIYLIHRPALMLAEEYIPAPHLTQAIIGIAATVLLSWAMLHWVEKPFGVLRKRFSHAAETANTTVPEGTRRARRLERVR